jgi:hypothetical protein
MPPRLASLSRAALLGVFLVGCKDERTNIAPAVTPPAPVASSVKAAPPVKVELPELAIRAGATSRVKVVWSSPPGTAVNEDAPFRVRWNRSDGIVDAPADVKGTGSRAADGFTLDVTPTPGAPNAVLTGEIDLVVCDVQTHAVCLPVKRSLELGFVVVKDGPSEAKVTIPLPQAKGG